MTSGLRFTVLGPVAASRDGVPVALGPARQTALLAVLLCRPGRPVSAAALVSAVWGEEPPGGGRSAIPPYVYRLRRLLGPDPALEHGRDGYALRIDPDAVDSTRFERLLRAASRDRDAGRPGSALAALRDGLALWHGEPFAELPGQLLAVERVRLTELRRSALAATTELELAAGDTGAALDTAWPAHLAEPAHERFTGLLMTALCRAGRQADALAAYRRTAAVLDDELGVTPGSELRLLHQAVLGGDPRLAGPPPGRQGRRYDVPAPAGPLFGRDTELRRLAGHRPAAGRCAVLAVEGGPGIGKTALLAHTARALDDAHPDGALYLDLHGSTPGRPTLTVGAALRALLGAVGVTPTDLPTSDDERAGLWRSCTSGRALLLVLDDVAATEQLTRLLPGAGGTVLAASRRPLDLPTIDVVALDPLAAGAAAELLRQAAGPGAADEDRPARQRVLECCRGHPETLLRAGNWLRRNRAAGLAGLAEHLAGPEAVRAVAS